MVTLIELLTEISKYQNIKPLPKWIALADQTCLRMLAIQFLL